MMPAPHLRPRSPAWLRLPRRTARLRFTAVYGCLFLLSGAVLVATTYVLFQRATEYAKPRLPQVPHTPAIQKLQLPLSATQDLRQLKQAQPQLPQALSKLAQAYQQLAQAQKLFLTPQPGQGLSRLALPLPLMAQDQRRLTQDQHQLTRDQRQLSQAVHQLSAAVHQVAETGSVQAAQRASDSHQLLVDSGIALGIMAALALLTGWLVAGRMLRPIRTITRTARRISSTSLHERLALDGPQDELKELGDTLDDLFGRLEAAFAAQRHFVANASHELRTPLTAERTMLQVALDDPDTSGETWRSTANDVLASNGEQQRLIEALLALASSESRLDHTERTDLADVCHAVLARPRPDHERLGLHLETAIRPAPLDGDPRLIERLVANLVDNAIGHNLEGGHVHISTDTTDGTAVLSVTNTGPIIPPTEIDRLFQPFQRLDPRRTHHTNGHGLGLGLSIVRAIAASHMATIDARPEPDGGLTVTVTFPPTAKADPPPGSTADLGTRPLPIWNAVILAWRRVGISFSMPPRGGRH
jgi:signal transduction histidine kinase